VPGKPLFVVVPLTLYRFVVIVELCERFTFYGLTPPFQNYIQNGPNDDPRGYLGLGQQGATGLGNFFQFWCYVTPILGAIVADQYLGRYKTIIVFACIYACGQLILVTSSIPSASRITHTVGLIIAMIVIGIGTGGIKSNVSALIVEQYTNTKRYIKVLKNGERVIVDPTVTIQRMYTWFYWAINIGGLSSLATTQLEARVDFWAAYLLPFCVFFLAIIVLITGKNKYVTRPPRGSVVLYAFKVMWIGIRNKFNLDAAKPSYQQSIGGNKHKTHWNDLFVDEIRRALVACRIFVFFPVYWVCYNQMLNNLISQAGQMERNGIPNDFLQNIDPITLIVFIPIMDLFIYPGLRKIGIHFRPITRIFFGFMFASAAMAFSAGIQVLPFIFELGLFPALDLFISSLL
jgi:proton-dependent oligopeptide transporter, POT family